MELVEVHRCTPHAPTKLGRIPQSKQRRTYDDTNVGGLGRFIILLSQASVSGQDHVVLMSRTSIESVN